MIGDDIVDLEQVMSEKKIIVVDGNSNCVLSRDKYGFRMVSEQVHASFRGLVWVFKKVNMRVGGVAVALVRVVVYGYRELDHAVGLKFLAYRAYFVNPVGLIP